MLMTIFGDIVLPHGGVAALGSLVKLGGLLGISEQTLRSSMNRLEAEGWLAREPQGRRALYQLSEQGEKRAISALYRIYQRARAPWSGEWNILVANAWAFEHDQKSASSQDLQWSGYGKVCDNVYVRPQREAETTCCFGRLGEEIAKKVVCFIARTPECLVHGPMDEMISRAWNLNRIDARYIRFVERYSGLARGLEQSEPPSPALALALRLYLIHDFRRIRLADPQLPDSLLPLRWLGGGAFDLAAQIYARLLPPSMAYIEEEIDGRDGPVSAAGQDFYARFDGLV